MAPDIGGRQPRSGLKLLALSLGALVLFSGFVALGTWQVKRRAWKLDLIARVEHRVHAPAVEAPGESQWPGLTAANSEYRRVRATGTLLNDSETLVQATTELGVGYWVMTPLRRADDTIVLINRGFVPSEHRDRASHDAAQPTVPATVTGLLRVTEPKGAFLRHNDPGSNRWYSRDVQAIAAAHGLSRVAPYFIDAEAAPALAPGKSAGSNGAPVPGLTVIAFRNSHLVYAITWYALALMTAAGTWVVFREERRLRLGPGARGALP